MRRRGQCSPSGYPTAAETERLVHLMEEAGEVVQECAKVLRYGWNSAHPDHLDLPNHRRLALELDQLRAVAQLMSEAGDVEEVSEGSKATNMYRKLRHMPLTQYEIHMAKETPT